MRFGMLPVQHGDGTRHFKILGASPGERALHILELLDEALQLNGDVAVVLEPEGRLEEAWRRLTPLTLGIARFGPAPWDLFDEFDSVEDVPRLMRRLVPAGDAEAFCSAVTQQLWNMAQEESEYHSNAALCDALLRQDGDKLKDLVRGTRAEAVATPPNGRRIRKVRQAIEPLMEAVEALAGERWNSPPPASVREWLAEKHAEQAVMFLAWSADGSFEDDEVGAVALIAALAGWAMEWAASRWESKRRLWFVLDGLDELPRIEGLPELLSKLTDRGIGAVLGFRSEATLDDRYGDEVGAILRACGHTLDLNKGYLKLPSGEALCLE